MKFDIPLTWRVNGVVTVEADSLELACDAVQFGDVDLPDVDQCNCMEGSIRIDEDEVHGWLTWKDVPKKVLIDLFDKVGGDGWTIFDCDWIVGLGVPQELVDRVTTVEKSDGTGKGSITANDGTLVAELRGVYSLTLHYRVARDLGLQKAIDESHGYSGRGFQAQHLAPAILEWCKGKVTAKKKAKKKAKK